jgi:hypothetical protein
MAGGDAPSMSSPPETVSVGFLIHAELLNRAEDAEVRAKHGLTEAERTAGLRRQKLYERAIAVIGFVERGMFKDAKAILDKRVPVRRAE